MSKHTLLLRLVGPMQAWGTQSRFTHRDTGREPSKSGVAGLICAALGRTRDQSVDDLAALKMGVRVDREGIMCRDYHTARDCVKADGSPGKNAVVSERFYLSDATFVVGLEGDDDERPLLFQIQAALVSPRWQLYLGRKSFLPTEPIVFNKSLQGLALLEALKIVPWRPPRNVRENKWPECLRLVLETDYGKPGTEIRQDQPQGAAFANRRFGLRYVNVDMMLRSDLPLEEVA